MPMAMVARPSDSSTRLDVEVQTNGPLLVRGAIADDCGGTERFICKP